MATALSGSCTSFNRRACMPPGDCEPSLGVMSVSANPTCSMAGAVSVRCVRVVITGAIRRHTSRPGTVARTMLSSCMCREGFQPLAPEDAEGLRKGSAFRGDVAQLGERLVCNQEVEGSIPFVSILTPCATRIYNCMTALRETRRSPDWISAKTVAKAATLVMSVSCVWSDFVR